MVNLTDLIPRHIVATRAFGGRRPDRRKATIDAQVHPIAFMHIPKTSGAAMRSGLAAAAVPEVTVDGFDPCLFGAYQDFESIDRSIRDSIYDSPHSMPQPANLIIGHFAFSTLRQAYPSAKLFTLLREPWSRLLSHWLFWRQHTDAELAPWGCFADCVKKARQPLAVFLDDPMLACQTDNLMLRMLLWPHPLLPPGRFIDPLCDAWLLREAMAHLEEFDFIDVIENGGMRYRLQVRLGRPFTYNRINETRPIPPQFRSPLHRELTPEAMELLESRSRLDCRLWAKIAGRVLSGRDIAKLRQRYMIASSARYGVLMGDADGGNNALTG